MNLPSFLALFKKGGSFLIDGPKAHLAAFLANETKRPILFLTGGTREDQLVAELSSLTKNVLEFPSWDTLPGEEMPPSPDIIGKRFLTLHELMHTQHPTILLCPLQSLLQKVAAPDALKKRLFVWKIGSHHPFDDLPNTLVSLGYKKAPVVSDKGEFAMRGGILDLFPAASPEPFRIEFFGDQIEGIRTFDPNGQMTIEKRKELFLCPTNELGSLHHSIIEYLGSDPIFLWDDPVQLEDNYVSLKKIMSTRPKFFYTLHDILHFKKNLQHIFFSSRDLFATEFELCEEHFRATHVSLPSSDSAPSKPLIRRQQWRSAHHSPASEFHALSPGDLVVHFHSGIGRFIGTEKHLDHLGKETEFFILEYAEQSKLFVPLSQAHLISRYIGSREELPSLSQLGNKKWQTTCAKAQAQIVGYANDLLQLYASRIVQGGFAYPSDSEIMQKFEKDFPYVETDDQLLAIEAIKQDMLSAKSMDRLICGDVGYGKTEVAMRAAFKAVVDGGKQVVVLVPTTVLAMQHFETFSQRMQGFPVQIGVVSRFRGPKEIRDTIQKTAEGRIDILIGTHRLLSKDVHWKDLGLVIIDEEQRFGVRMKEKLKKFKTGVDYLTLSATPIPRTLYMSLVHARDMSTISTPPQDRLPVKSIIAEIDPELIQNALIREFARGGQAYFIHNRVETIQTKAETIGKLVPSARIAIVHGQMDPDTVDLLFHQFKQGEINLLFATTIVENGVDIPNANTIFIDRSDTYGLADLYQLRGRVGRWNRTAYAYFLVPKNTRLPELSMKRLNALVESGGYGGGMKIAMRDLEIRGAGDILGVQQSGQVSSIGFHLYCKLLKRAIDALKKERPISFHETKMEFLFNATLPSSYINEFSLRMELYYRLGEATSYSEIDALLAEMKDRFGPPPPPVIWLYHMTRIRAFAAANHFSILKFNDITLIAEQQKGKLIEKKTLLLPKKVQNPESLELHVLKELSTHFTCTTEV